MVRCEARNHLEDLPGYANTVIGDLLSEVAHLDERIKQYDAHIHTMARDCALAQRLMQLKRVPDAPIRDQGRVVDDVDVLDEEAASRIAAARERLLIPTGGTQRVVPIDMSDQEAVDRECERGWPARR